MEDERPHRCRAEVDRVRHPGQVVVRVGYADDGRRTWRESRFAHVKQPGASTTVLSGYCDAVSPDSQADLSCQGKAAPLGEIGGTVLLESRAGGEAAFEVEPVCFKSPRTHVKRRRQCATTRSLAAHRSEARRLSDPPSESRPRLSPPQVVKLPDAVAADRWQPSVRKPVRSAGS